MPGFGFVRRNVYRQHDGGDRRGARTFASRLRFRIQRRPAEGGIFPCCRSRRDGPAPKRHPALRHPHSHGVRKRRRGGGRHGRLDEHDTPPASHRPRSRSRTDPERHPRHLAPHAANRQHEARWQVRDARPRSRRGYPGRDEATSRCRTAPRRLHDCDRQDRCREPGARRCRRAERCPLLGRKPHFKDRRTRNAFRQPGPRRRRAEGGRSPVWSKVERARPGLRWRRGRNGCASET